MPRTITVKAGTNVDRHDGTVTAEPFVYGHRVRIVGSTEYQAYSLKVSDLSRPENDGVLYATRDEMIALRDALTIVIDGTEA